MRVFVTGATGFVGNVTTAKQATTVLYHDRGIHACSYISNRKALDLVMCTNRKPDDNRFDGFHFTTTDRASPALMQYRPDQERRGGHCLQ